MVFVKIVNVCFVVFAVMFLVVIAGCGDVLGPEDDSWGRPVREDECRVGFGDCPGAMMCIQGMCEPVKGQRIELTIETGEMPEDRVYWVTVRDRNQEVLLETSRSFSSKDPLWYESTTLYLDKMTDRWTLEISASGWFTGSLRFSCGFEFSPMIFEKERRFECRADSDKRFVYSIRPL